MSDKPSLGSVYDLKPDETAAYYDDWASRYDAELGANSYVTPTRCATALAATDLPMDAPILDFGCGTGLSAAALSKAGFTVIDGMDISAGMLEQARAKGIYRNLIQAPNDAPPPIPHGAYAAITAIGAISPGAAPPSLLSQVVDALAPGGLLCLSYNEYALRDADYLAALEAEKPRLQTLSEETGAHVEGVGSTATVYIFRRL